MRLLSRVVATFYVAASGVIVSQAGAADGRALGAPFPGAQIGSAETVNGCGERYKFSSNAPLASVAKFYLDEGSGSGLTLLKDTDVGDPTYRMISFIRPHGHQVLFVTLTKTSNVVSGTVYYLPGNRLPCR
jgi:hypothetical protein